MMNGCICCTVRADLAVVLKKLKKTHESGKPIEAIVIETTGMADPAPVAQTFFVDDEIASFCQLDGIVTLVDAKHIVQHLDEEKPEGAENESVEQVAFADRLILNKCDLVPKEEDLKAVETRLRSINKFAPIVRSTKSEVSPDQVLGIGAFDLKRTLEMDPEFLDTEGEHDNTTTTCVEIKFSRSSLSPATSRAPARPRLVLGVARSVLPKVVEGSRATSTAGLFCSRSVVEL